jgi:hypothetical protein
MNVRVYLPILFVVGSLLYTNCADYAIEDAKPPAGVGDQNSLVTNSTPPMVPVLDLDFQDKVGIAVNTVVSSQARISNLAADQVISVNGFDAALSLDNLAWTGSVKISSGQTFYIRMTSAAALNANRTATVSAGSLTLDWTVSTQPLISSFDTPGVFTWNRPPAGTAVKFECWGAGGGGGAGGGAGTYGGGGGGGGYSIKTVPLNLIGATETITIGTGGANSLASYQNGGDGGNSSVGAHILAAGGKGGINISQGGAGGAGGMGITATGMNGVNPNGGTAAGPGGGAGGGSNATGTFPGGGGGGSVGGGGGGTGGNGAGAAGKGANGKCNVTIIPL